MRTYFPLLVAFVLSTAVWASPSAIQARKWKVSHPPEQFARDVVAGCLTSPQSKISVTDTSIQVTDTSKCTLEIEKLSKVWEKDPSRGMASANLHRRNPAQVKRKLQHAMDDLKEGQLGFEPPLSACPCIVMTGPRASEAAEIVKRGDLDDMPDLPADATP